MQKPVRYFGVGLSSQDARTIEEYFERYAPPECVPEMSNLRLLPLTFNFAGSQVQISNLPYTRLGPNVQFYRAVTLEIKGKNTQSIFAGFASECAEIACCFKKTEKVYPYAGVLAAHEEHVRSSAIGLHASEVPDYLLANLEEEPTLSK
ncbi:MAG TPA: hypothetical protein VJJ82_01755 [Candidatus Nanoarchaeia archaeon]|nr:hypothetical protein [Candidatus Nanoarchaeia archaeon]